MAGRTIDITDIDWPKEAKESEKSGRNKILFFRLFSFFSAITQAVRLSNLT